MRATGWHVIDVFDGDTSVDDIVHALNLARSYRGKPIFINIRTTIGYGTATAGTFKSHHGTYSDADAALYAERPDGVTHQISQEAQAYFEHCKIQGDLLERDWKARLALYCKALPEKGSLLLDRIAGKFDIAEVLGDLQLSQQPAASREINGVVFNKILDACPSILAGGADLWNSNQLGDQSHRILDAKNPSGQVVRYGIREHAMASIANGLAAYSPGTFIPVTATFFMFYLYAAPGVRMGALSRLKVIHVATHDSIGEGQNGPTHQPVELDSLYRAMPNLLYIRPATAEEVVGAWLVALNTPKHSFIISLARDPPETQVPNTGREKVARGGYVVLETPNATVTLVSCGSELQFATAAASRLSDAHGIATRVVSMPCIRLFEAQDEEYQRSVLSDSTHIISVEAYISSMWSRFCTASIALDSFGYSGAGRENFRRFGVDTDGIVKKVASHVQCRQTRRWKLLK